MKKNLVFLLALAIAGGSVQQGVAKTNLYAAGKVGSHLASGVAQILRLEQYKSTDASKIRKYASAALIASVVALIADALYRNNSNLSPLANNKILECLAPLRMYLNADDIAQKNKTISPSECKKIDDRVIALKSMVYGNLLLKLPAHVANNKLLKHFEEMLSYAFPVAEYFFYESYK